MTEFVALCHYVDFYKQPARNSSHAPRRDKDQGYKMDRSAHAKSRNRAKKPNPTETRANGPLDFNWARLLSFLSTCNRPATKFQPRRQEWSLLNATAATW